MSASFVIAWAGNQRIAFDATAVESIIRLGEITPVPCAPQHVLGLCAIRSAVMTVIDVARAAGQLAEASSSHAAIVNHDGHRYALRIDRVEDIEIIDPAPIPNSAGIGSGWHAIAPSRIDAAGGLALLMDIDAVITAGQRN